SPNQLPRFLWRMKRWQDNRARSPLHSSPGQAPTTAPDCRTARSLSGLAFLTFTRRIPDNDASRFYVLHRYGSCTYNCSFADCDPRPDECLGANPRLGTDHDRRTQQRKIGLGIIVRSRAKVRAMRDRLARPERDLTEIINKHLLAYRAVVSGLEIPRKINCRRWIHMHASTNLCAETTKQKSSPAEARPGTKPKKRLRQRP